MAKYLKVWQGRIQHGRDQGHPITKTWIMDSFRELANDYTGEEDKLEYYKLEKLEIDEDEIKKIKNKIKEEERQKEIKYIEKEIEKLKEKLIKTRVDPLEEDDID